MYCDYYQPPTEVIWHPVCRFSIQNLCSRKGRAKNDFQVDLVLTVDGLLTLVKSAYRILRRHQKLEENFRNLHWRIHFQGEVFTLADSEVHHFNLLRYPLHDGQSGWFEGSNASFRFTVTQAMVDEICPSKIVNYPKMDVVEAVRPRTTAVAVAKSFTPSMKEDWLSADSKAQAQDFNHKFREYMSGANVWSQNATGEFFRDRPKPPKWSTKEEDVLLSLIRAGCKFQESWQSILRHAFINRSEVGVAQQWYKIRKRASNDASLDLSDRSSDSKLIVEAKTLCSEILEDHLRAGVPELGDHPLKRKLSGEITSESQESISLGNTSSMLKKRRVSISAIYESIECESNGESLLANSTSNSNSS